MLDDVLRAGEKRLSAAGIDSARNDTEVLVAHALDVERSALTTLTILGSRLDAAQVLRVNDLLDRRVAREPLQHIVGRAGFRRIELAVGPGVFVPRPETELVAALAIDELHRALADSDTGEVMAVDLCSGSGALALAIATEVPQARVHAVELSDDAVLWLQRNVDELGLRETVTVHHDDAGHAPVGLDGMVDVVVCNPPYIPDGASIRDQEAAIHDPGLALWGGPDGLDVVRSVIGHAESLLRTGGLLVIEHADVQGEALPLLIGARGDANDRPWTDIEDHLDLNDLPRFTSARRAASVAVR